MFELSLQLKAQNNYYTIEASTDLANWEQIVEPFFAEENYHILKVRVQDGIRYFRAIQLPWLLHMHGSVSRDFISLPE